MFSLDYYDAVLLTGEFQIQEIRELEQKRNLPAKDIEVVGCTYMDVLKEQLDQAPKGQHDGFTVLLAPSWGASSLLVRYGSRIIDSLLNTGYRIIIRPHPQSFRSDKEIMDELQKKYPDSDRISWDSNPSNFDSLNASDIMISDYSSSFFDYAICNKPMRCFAYDYEQYEKERGFYFSPEEELPCPIHHNEDEIIESIISIDFEADSKKTSEFANKYTCHEGHACEAVTNKILEQL